MWFLKFFSVTANNIYHVILLQTDTLLMLVSPLVRDQADQPDQREIDMQDFVEEQSLMGRFLHMLQSDDPDQQFLVY